MCLHAVRHISAHWHYDGMIACTALGLQFPVNVSCGHQKFLAGVVAVIACSKDSIDTFGKFAHTAVHVINVELYHTVGEIAGILVHDV